MSEWVYQLVHQDFVAHKSISSGAQYVSRDNKNVPV